MRCLFQLLPEFGSMAFIQCEFESEILGRSCSLYVLLNQTALLDQAPGHKSPVLYLLHGLSDNHTDWMRRTSIERYAAAYDLAVVMPAVERSFYTNMHAGYRYLDFVANELPEVCQALFPIAGDRENVFAAGLSMGGYGAFKLALSRPEKYAAAASLSGALDLWARDEEAEEKLPDWRLIFGDRDRFPGSENDLMHLVSELARSKGPQPRLYQCCGTEDYLYPMNQSFRNRCRAEGVPLTYEEEAGDHNWAYWDSKIQRVLEWLPLRVIGDESDDLDVGTGKRSTAAT